MINFCTLFDSAYLSRGLALYASLQKVTTSFHLYVVAFDNKSYGYLKDSQLPNLTVISLTDFEDNKLLEIKPSRNTAEYCWTCTSSVILYCLEKFKLPSCTYLDADMFFFNDPKLLLDEIGTNAVLLTEHRFTQDYDLSATHGIYCVQFMYFKNSKEGLTVLKWWRERCLEWCYDRVEDGKFGDQKYLDDWPLRFKSVRVLQHLGGGVAPWNVQQYDLEHHNGDICLKNKKDNHIYPLVFFHFHGLRFFNNGFVSLAATSYELNSTVKELIYFPYIKKLLQIEKDLKDRSVSIDMLTSKPVPHGKRKVYFDYLRNFFYKILHGRASPFKLENYSLKMHYHFYKLDRFK